MDEEVRGGEDVGEDRGVMEVVGVDEASSVVVVGVAMEGVAGEHGGSEWE
jgi:hypothetical protein